MRPANLAAGIPALVIASLALGLGSPAAAQNDSGLSSGSGSGTGSGRSAGVYPPPGVRGNGIGPDQGTGAPPAPGPRDFGGASFGPGINVQFPDDPMLAPFLSLEGSETPGEDRPPVRVRGDMIESAKQTAEAGERGRILLQITRGAILGNQLRTANAALVEAADAAEHEDDVLIHDQLVISIVTTAGLLSDALLREAKPQLALFADDARAEPLPSSKLEPDVAIRLARLEWRRSVYMAARIKNPTYRSEYLERSIENMAGGGATIATEYARPLAEEARDKDKKDASDKHAEYIKQSDEILLEAVQAARMIERPIWKFHALERIAVAASQSRQYDRATRIAESIPNAEARARALTLVAESQARSNQNAAATESYNLAAKAVSAIQQNGLRGVLAGILIDSLISTGRFEDARASLVLYPTESEQFVAMGAIAESQGVRRMGPEARRWIENEAPAQYRSTLIRRLSNGLLRAISEDRAKEFQSRGLDAG